MCCLSAASPRDAARLWGVVRVLREWGLARSAPSSPLARACALHLLCRDAGFVHDAGTTVMAGLRVRSGVLLVCLRARGCPFRYHMPARAACALHLLPRCRGLLLHDAMSLSTSP